MKSLKSLFLALFILCPLMAETGTPSVYVEVEKIEPVKIAVGKDAKVIVKFKVVNGLHVQANPAALANLKPTTLVFPPQNGLESLPPLYPPGKPYRMLNTTQDLSVYEGEVEIRIPIKAVNATIGPVDFKGELKYQACNDKICFFPRTEKITIPVQIVKK